MRKAHRIPGPERSNGCRQTTRTSRCPQQSSSHAKPVLIVLPKIVRRISFQILGLSQVIPGQVFNRLTIQVLKSALIQEPGKSGGPLVDGKTPKVLEKVTSSSSGAQLDGKSLS